MLQKSVICILFIVEEGSWTFFPVGFCVFSSFIKWWKMLNISGKKKEKKKAMTDIWELWSHQKLESEIGYLERKCVKKAGSRPLWQEFWGWLCCGCPILFDCCLQNDKPLVQNQDLANIYINLSMTTLNLICDQHLGLCAKWSTRIRQEKNSNLLKNTSIVACLAPVFSSRFLASRKKGSSEHL